MWMYTIIRAHTLVLIEQTRTEMCTCIIVYIDPDSKDHFFFKITTSGGAGLWCSTINGGIGPCSTEGF